MSVNKMNLIILDFFKKRLFLITWISLVIYIFYNTFEFYRHGCQFRHLRKILGLGLCISRGTATVLNICCALVLLPLCKKLNQILYLVLSKYCPRLFFFWLENAKRLHMSVGITISVFSVIHSGSHFVNVWNFWLNSDNEWKIMGHASYKTYNPVISSLIQPLSTGVVMLFIILSMSVSSLRTVRRNSYNVFWYIHQSYFLFLVMLLLHPLSGVLKEEVIDVDASQYGMELFMNTTTKAVFLPIKSMTWTWMSLPLTCFTVDLCWRFIARNRSRLLLQKVEQFPGRVISLTLKCDNQLFNYRAGQYILLQCQQISVLEWHPFTVVKVSNNEKFTVWIRVKGDWTEELERKLLDEPKSRDISLLLDGPYFSPMEKLANSEVAICIAAGVGITPYVSILQSMFEEPRSKYPGRLHMIWIVRYEHEITWIGELLNKTMIKLINSNKPDRLHVEFYVTFQNNKQNSTTNGLVTDHIVTFNERNGLGHIIKKYNEHLDEEKVTLLTPNMKRSFCNNDFIKVEIMEKNTNYIDSRYKIAKFYPLLDCRLRRGRPKWDKLFKFWINLYPNYNLNLFCCGPKTLSSLLRTKCAEATHKTTTKFSFISEGFS